VDFTFSGSDRVYWQVSIFCLGVNYFRVICIHTRFLGHVLTCTRFAKKDTSVPIFSRNFSIRAWSSKDNHANFSILVDGPEVAKIVEPSMLKILFVIVELKHSSAEVLFSIAGWSFVLYCWLKFCSLFAEVFICNC